MPLVALVLALLVLPLSQDGRAQRRVKVPTAAELAAQPFALHVERVADALAELGAPLTDAERAKIAEARAEDVSKEHADVLAALLEPRVLAVVAIEAEDRVSVRAGPAAAVLHQHDARTFLVRVENACATTATLAITSPEAFEADASRDGRWLELRQYVSPFVRRELAGLAREYRVIALGTAESGKRAATLKFATSAAPKPGAESSTAAPRADAKELALAFESLEALPVRLTVRDEAGRPATAAFTVRDAHGGFHPAEALRTGADLRFQEQVYRADGETLWLQPGEYVLTVRRGPESRELRRMLVVSAGAPSTGSAPSTGARGEPAKPNDSGAPLTPGSDTEPANTPKPKPERGNAPQELVVELERWIDPAASKWWSGDHHVHGSGCMHYLTPGGNIGPEDLLRHARGEDLKVADCLVWGVGWDEQQGYFTGAQDTRSTPPYVLRYDVEVSGFGSERAGHWALLGLKRHWYDEKPGIVHWPELGLTTLAWAKRQGAFTSTVHSGLGLAVDTRELPNFVVPPFDNIGANEFVVDVTHELEGPDGKLRPAVDLYGVGDTAYPWELNLYYHVLRAGYRVRMAGEDDFPCLDESAIGRGRSYVKVRVEAKDLTTDAWIAGLVAGRSYVGDGRSHLMDFQVDDVEVGTRDVKLAAPGMVKVRANAAALLPLEPDPELSLRSWKSAPYWHVERARIPGTREVEVELLVDGAPIAKQRLMADGNVRPINFETAISQSSWVALRILPTSHTNPIWIEVAGQPYSPRKDSTAFLLKCVDQCWSQKSRTYTHAADLEAAKGAYEHARQTYRTTGPAQLR
ncbi:MAG: CehA/McbA family metallohydrolase [Planctomycetes bacterium]|nr:CehA/McbA family metallohydrolase [Planctomycetota bacterium]